MLSGRVNLKVHMLNDATTPTGEPKVCLLLDWSSPLQLMHQQRQASDAPDAPDNLDIIIILTIPSKIAATRAALGFAQEITSLSYMSPQFLPFPQRGATVSTALSTTAFTLSLST